MSELLGIQGGRLFLHLAEQKHNNDFPFAFLVSYCLPAHAHAPLSHIPLSRLLKEYSVTGEKNAWLLEILLPLQKAAQKSNFLFKIVEDGSIFQSLALTSNQAYAFLRDIPFFEQEKITVRVPNWWSCKKPARPQINIKIGDTAPALAGLDSLLDFDACIMLPDGQELSVQELQDAISSGENFVRIRGQWLEIDALQLDQVLQHWKTFAKQGISLSEGLRMLSAVPGTSEAPTNEPEEMSWSRVVAGDHLKTTLEALRNPALHADHAMKDILSQHLRAHLRPYQEQGVAWLWMLYSLRLGGCLADDMGLGKTMQVLSLLLLVQEKFCTNKHLLIVPASLLGNWVAEIKRFAPRLRYRVLHRSEIDMSALDTCDVSGIDLVITTYALVGKLRCLSTISWDTIIIDEAQAIKNPTTQQTRNVQALQGRVKFALTGTPIENNLLDLWSLFHFVAPGLLGGSKNFAQLMNDQDEKQKKKKLCQLKRLVSPYILRRLKSDKRIIDDLPDKTELLAYCTLTTQQITLYQQSVDELTVILENNEVDGMKRRGLVLSFLMRLKQICNHPNQWLGRNHYPETASGKFVRLQELCAEIAQKREKVLVFTQFRELVPTLSHFLASIFGRPGLELHGATAVKKRTELVAAFQQENGPPFFVLSLKAGGTGLNLTHASHVIHFDRWWNPAVENQATDRAYRIGQKKNVLVHKFICSGTIEEKIDELIHQKRSLVDSVIGTEKEIVLSELSNEELLNVISLDLNRVFGIGK